MYGSLKVCRVLLVLDITWYDTACIPQGTTDVTSCQWAALCLIAAQLRCLYLHIKRNRDDNKLPADSIVLSTIPAGMYGCVYAG